MTFPLLLDDAAIFPPGNLPLAEAVRAHLAHGVAPYADMVGPLVVSLADLPALAEATADLPAGSIALSVTVPSPASVSDAVDRVRGIRAVTLAALEVAVPDGLAATDVMPALDAALVVLGDGNPRWANGIPAGQQGFHHPGGETATTVYVELPRDDRRTPLITALTGTPYRAKLRTGGVRADLHPDESELAEAVVALVRAGVPFKATAGLHHALRNTDPTTGFEQHGFLNLLTATAAAGGGADVQEVASILAERDVRRLPQLPHAPGTPGARDTPGATLFGSIGTCSISEPVDELTDLGLLPEVVR
ncbi:MAG TPA: hypothetical protein VNS46_10710 [Nocardioides sp.]|nr:hypothetical protein [Nocardioides sp.]